MRSPFVDLLDAFGRAAAAHDLGWYLFGVQAALLYGANRLTADVDVTVHLGTCATQTFVGDLMEQDFRLLVWDDAFVEQTRVLPVIHTPTGITADVVLAGPGLEELFLQLPPAPDEGPPCVSRVGNSPRRARAAGGSGVVAGCRE